MPQPSEDEAQIVADGGEHGVVLIAMAASQEVAAEMAVLLHMADDGLDAGTAAQLAFDHAMYAALLA